MKLDTEARSAKLSDGEELRFGQAVLATGANVRRLRVDGGALDGIHYLRALGNADAIRAAAADVEHVVLIGGSYIACEVAASLTAQGKRCTLLAAERLPLSLGFGRAAGEFFGALLREKGIDWVGGDALARFEGDERVERVVTESGRTIEAELVVMGTGVVPDVMLARSAGLALGESGGIACSDTLETSVPGIWAAGDACEYDSTVHGRRLRVEHWEVARAQGAAVAAAVRGEAAPYTEIPYFWSDLADWCSLEYVGPAQQLGRRGAARRPRERRVHDLLPRRRPPGGGADRRPLGRPRRGARAARAGDARRRFRARRALSTLPGHAGSARAAGPRPLRRLWRRRRRRATPPRAAAGRSGPRPASRAPRSPPRASATTCTSSAASSGAAARRPARSSATTSRATAGRASPTCRSRSTTRRPSATAGASTSSAATATRARLTRETSVLLRYDPGRDGWRRLASMPTARGALAAGVIRGRIYAVGGANAGGNALATLEVYDVRRDRWRSAPPMRLAREHLAAAVAGGRFYALAGRATGAGNFRAVEAYDPRARRWRRVPDMAKARGGIAAATVGRRIIVVGGEEAAGTIAEVERYDPRTRRWRRLPDMPTPRHGLGAVARGDQVLVFEGGDEPGYAFTPTLEVLSAGSC